MSDAKPRLRFKRQPGEQGLARVCQGPRGYELWYGDRHLGAAYHHTEGWGMRTGKFYWAVGAYPELGIPHQNTHGEPVATMDEAKAALRAYVVKFLRAKGLRG